ncbi:hypothetical protein [Sinomonas sp. B1-1]|uniref:hypothetical protein n=1 Tax=Sinomonas sp. B1-1 TaxID=3141454 RepID=UPI003D2C640A
MLWGLAALLTIFGLFASLSPEPLIAGTGASTVGLIAGLALLRTISGPIHPFSAGALIGYSHVALFVLRPLYALVYQDGVNLFNGMPFDQSVVAAQQTAGLGIFSIYVGMAAAGPNLAFKPTTLPANRSVQRHVALLPYLWLAVVVGVSLYSVYIARTGLSQFAEILTTGRTALASSSVDGTSAYFYAGLEMATGALIGVVLVASLAGLRLHVFFALAALILCAVPSLAAGSRSVFVPTVIALLLIGHLVKPRAFSARKFATVAPAAFILLFIAPRLWRVDLAEGGSLTEALAAALRPENFLGDFLGSFDTAMLDAFALQVSAQSSGVIGLRFGGTYDALFLAFIPRTLWGDKPLSVDQILNSYLFPITHEKGIGFSFGIYSEPTLNFGLVGVVGVGFAFGYIAARVWRKSQHSGDVRSLYIAILVTSYLFPLMRGSISFDSQRLFIAALPAVFFLALGKEMGLDVKTSVKAPSTRKLLDN